MTASREVASGIHSHDAFLPPQRYPTDSGFHPNTTHGGSLDGVCSVRTALSKMASSAASSNAPGEDTVSSTAPGALHAAFVRAHYAASVAAAAGPASANGGTEGGAALEAFMRARLRRNLHVVLSCDPTHPAYEHRLAMHPALHTRSAAESEGAVMPALLLCGMRVRAYT